MIKDTTRDYVTDAFRFYAALGKPKFEDLKQQIYEDALELAKKDGIKTNNICSPTELSIMKAEQAVMEKKSELEDILAVERTLSNMIELRGPDVKKAIEIVYFTEPNKELAKGDIRDKVQYAANELHADERTIYRWLAIARRVFCMERGLRTSNNKIYKVLRNDVSSRG